MPVVDKERNSEKIVEDGVRATHWVHKLHESAVPSIELNDARGVSWEWDQISTYGEVGVAKDGLLPVLGEDGFNSRVDLEFARIIIGGNILSRGFTLQGLSTSYFARKTAFADSLLQMERWFGYRDDYRELTRLFIDNEPTKDGRAGKLAKAKSIRKNFRQVAILDSHVREALQRLEGNWFENASSAIEEVRTIGLDLKISGNSNNYKQTKVPYNLYRTKFNLPFRGSLGRALQSSTNELISGCGDMARVAAVSRRLPNEPSGRNASYWYVGSTSAAQVRSWLRVLQNDPDSKFTTAVQYLAFILDRHPEIPFKLIVRTLQGDRGNDGPSLEFGGGVIIHPSTSGNETLLSGGRSSIPVSSGGPHSRALDAAFKGASAADQIVLSGNDENESADELHKVEGFWGHEQGGKDFVALLLSFTRFESQAGGAPLIGAEVAIPEWFSQKMVANDVRFGFAKKPPVPRRRKLDGKSSGGRK